MPSSRSTSSSIRKLPLKERLSRNRMACAAVAGARLSSGPLLSETAGPAAGKQTAEGREASRRGCAASMRHILGSRNGLTVDDDQADSASHALDWYQERMLAHMNGRDVGPPLYAAWFRGEFTLFAKHGLACGGSTRAVSEPFESVGDSHG